MEAGTASVGGSAVTINLANTYVSPVVVCSIQYGNNTVPVVARVRNVTSNSFQVRLQNPSGAGVAAETISYIVMEEGVWTIDGVNCEAVRYTATNVQGRSAGWGSPSVRSYGQAYSSPVVIGQVMSENDARWSTFWNRGSSRSAPPNASNLQTGMQIAEDQDTSRNDELIGYIVFESGHGTIGGVEYEAALGADTVRGAVQAAPYDYTFNTAFGGAPSVAVVTQAAMDGNNGGWAYTVGGASATTLGLAIDEDQTRDNERNHTTEQVGYVVFRSSVVVN